MSTMLSKLPVLVLVLLVTATFLVADDRTDQIKSNDKVIAVYRTSVKTGKDELLVAEKETQMVAVTINGDWVGVRVQQGGKTVTGWVYAKHLIRSSVIKWLPLLRDARFAAQRAEVERPFVRAQSQRTRLTTDGYRTVIAAAARMTATLSQMRGEVTTADYTAAWRFLDGMANEANGRLRNRQPGDIVFREERLGNVSGTTKHVVRSETEHGCHFAYVAKLSSGKPVVVVDGKPGPEYDGIATPVF